MSLFLLRKNNIYMNLCLFLLQKNENNFFLKNSIQTESDGAQVCLSLEDI